MCKNRKLRSMGHWVVKQHYHNYIGQLFAKNIESWAICLRRLFEFINDLLHTRSRLGNWLQTSSDECTQNVLRHQCDLLFTSFRIWQFSNADLTKKNTKTVHIKLSTKKISKWQKWERFFCNFLPALWGCFYSTTYRMEVIISRKKHLEFLVVSDYKNHSYL